nr:ribonuclease H-like domain-containing protein [Tanacetum cinerariifolium]
MNQFCEMKGILRQFSVARTPQQNRVTKRRNMTLTETARTMLADSMLPTTFWVEAVNTACDVQNRVLVVKPHNKTLYELFHGITPTLSFMRPFGCHVTILNIIDHLGKFDGKADKGFFIGYSLNSKAFRVFNGRTRIVKENLHISSNVNAAGTNENNELPFDPNMPDLEDVRIFNFSNNDEDDDIVADINNMDTTIQVSPIPTTRIHKDHPLDQMDVKSAFLYGKIEEEVYVRQPPGFEDPNFHDKVYKVEKVLYGLHQAPRAWFTKVKNASTPMETQKPLLKGEDGEKVDVHMYSTMAFVIICLATNQKFNFSKWIFDNMGRNLDNLSRKLLMYPRNMRRNEKGFFERITLLFPTIVVESQLDEAVHKELRDSLVRATTTASSLEAEQDNKGYCNLTYKGGSIEFRERVEVG